MKKLFQNQVAESAATLPVTVLLALVVWVAAGLITRHWWVQLACMGLAVYLLIELSNSNALIRVRSRMVSTVFLVLSCCHPMLFGSASGNFVTLCFIVSLFFLFSTYQAPSATGRTFYAYFFLGLSSLAHPQTLYLLPLFWLLAITHFQSLDLRSWVASLLGILAPYWIAAPFVLFYRDFQGIVRHFAQLADFHFPLTYESFTVGQLASFGFVMLLFFVSGIHFWQRSFEDRIRTRQQYGFLAWILMAATLIMALQPQLYEPMIRIVIVCASPFIAHFFTLTYSKFSNWLFMSCIAAAVILMLINLSESMKSLVFSIAIYLWNGLLNF